MGEERGAEVNMTANLGTRGIDAARNLLKYCNHPGGTAWSDLRRSHGVEQPHNSRTWCLGNEMDGPWQLRHTRADAYGLLAAQTAAAMKEIDPTIELIAAGSSNSKMPTYPEWEATVLDHAYEHVEYISLHIYCNNLADDLSTFLAQSLDLDRYIETVASVCDCVQAKKRSSRRLNIAFDEWNIWYHAKAFDREYLEQHPWQVAPPLAEERYTLEDALVVGTMLMSLMRHADRVKIDCLAQLVNVLAPIMTATGGGVWRQTTYWPFLHASRFGQGAAVDIRVASPVYDNANFGDVPLLDAIATLDEANEELTIFAVNYWQDDPLPIEGDLPAPEGYRVLEYLVLTHGDPKAPNTADAPETAVPHAKSDAALHGGTLTATLPDSRGTSFGSRGPSKARSRRATVVGSAPTKYRNLS